VSVEHPHSKNHRIEETTLDRKDNAQIIGIKQEIKLLYKNEA
jgi:hypothetical protein